VTVDFVTSNGTADGSDYTDSDQTLTFGNGVTSQTVQIPITNDPDDENFTETILLALRNPTNGAFLGFQPTATLSITDDDVVPPTFTTQPVPRSSHCGTLKRMSPTSNYSASD
jgi:hypothetical protein